MNEQEKRTQDLEEARRIVKETHCTHESTCTTEYPEEGLRIWHCGICEKTVKMKVPKTAAEQEIPRIRKKILVGVVLLLIGLVGKVVMLLHSLGDL